MRLCEACVDTLRAQGGAFTFTAVAGELVAVSAPGVCEECESLQEVLDEFPIFSQLAPSVGSGTTLYAVPMRVGGRVVGAFSIYVTTGSLARHEEELRVLADTAGTTLMGDAVIRAHGFARSTSLWSVVVDVYQRRLTFSHDE